MNELQPSKHKLNDQLQLLLQTSLRVGRAILEFLARGERIDPMRLFLAALAPTVITGRGPVDFL